MAKRFDCDTTRDVTDALGGLGAVRKLFPDFTLQRIENWNRADNFPPETYLTFQRALQRVRKTAPASLWRMVGEIEERRSA